MTSRANQNWPNETYAAVIDADVKPQPLAVPTRAAEKYIQRIKHPAKKQYASDYYRWILAGRPGHNGPEYDRDKLTYMGAQAVRMNLDEIYS